MPSTSFAKSCQCPVHVSDVQTPVQLPLLSRYASTLVSSTVENTEDVAREVFFSVFLPETAFISRFCKLLLCIVFILQVCDGDWGYFLRSRGAREGGGLEEVQGRRGGREDGRWAVHHCMISPWRAQVTWGWRPDTATGSEWASVPWSTGGGHLSILCCISLLLLDLILLPLLLPLLLSLLLPLWLHSWPYSCFNSCSTPASTPAPTPAPTSAPADSPSTQHCYFLPAVRGAVTEEGWTVPVCSQHSPASGHLQRHPAVFTLSAN